MLKHVLKEKEQNSGRIQVKQLYSLNTNLDFLDAVAELYTCFALGHAQAEPRVSSFQYP